MGNFKLTDMRKIIVFIILTGLCTTLFAQETGQEEQKYRRNALYSILLSHSDSRYAKEIEEVFNEIPIPDRFDNHDLSVKILTVDSNKAGESDISSFFRRNNVARRMVAHWFERDPKTGQCSMDLIMNRGLYDASFFDVEIAKMSQRGIGILADAGEDLINNTFVVVNDIRYKDKSKSVNVLGKVMAVIPYLSELGYVISDIKGFGVTVTSYLYRLEWNDDIAENFYSNCYIERGKYDPQKKASFDYSQAFHLKYIGKQTVSSGQTSVKGVLDYDPIAMIRKVCTRAIDRSLAELQHSYEEFRIKTPIYSVTPAITAKIGLKEGVTEKSKYEVLERVVDNNGRTSYKRVGIVQPVAGRIWDNRYMAVEEGAANSRLEATTFRKLSGGDFYPGMLIREIK